jgi:glycine cleavage system T protein (aminomethyltransferase)
MLHKRLGNLDLAAQVWQRKFASAKSSARHTALYPIHVREGGKMVEYGDYMMPLSYSPQTILDSVKWTRTHASLFDVTPFIMRAN